MVMEKGMINMKDLHVCACGCSQLCKRTYVSGHYRRGKKLSDIHKQRISESSKGKIISKSCREKISKKLTGRHLSEEHKRNTIIGLKGKRGGLFTSKNKKGIPLTDVHKQRISDSLKNVCNGKLKGRYAKEKNPWFGKHPSEKSIALLKEARLNQIMPLKDSKIERMVQAELTNREHSFITHYPIFGQPDISFNEIKLAIFTDGCYWHSCPICNFDKKYKFVNEIKDKRVTEYLQSKGWTVLRYWEHEILANPDAVVDEIEDVLVSRYMSQQENTEVLL